MNEILSNLLVGFKKRLIFLTPILLGGLVAGVLIAVSALTLKFGFDIPIAKQFRDVSALGDVPSVYGLFSQTGLLIWAVGLGALVLTRFTSVRESKGRRRYLNYCIGLTFVLLLDDAFMLHEDLFADATGDLFVVLLYGGGISVLLLIFSRQLLWGPYPLLLVALVFLGFSMVFDLVPNRSDYVHSEVVYLIEDGAKIVGILFWSLFHLVSCRELIMADRIATNDLLADVAITNKQPSSALTYN